MPDATPLRGRGDTPRRGLAREPARKGSDCTTPSFGRAARTHGGHGLCIIPACTVRCSVQNIRGDRNFFSREPTLSDNVSSCQPVNPFSESIRRASPSGPSAKTASSTAALLPALAVLGTSSVPSDTPCRTGDQSLTCHGGLPVPVPTFTPALQCPVPASPGLQPWDPVPVRVLGQGLRSQSEPVLRRCLGNRCKNDQNSSRTLLIRR